MRRSKIEAAINATEEAMKGNDKDAIEAKTARARADLAKAGREDVRSAGGRGRRRERRNPAATQDAEGDVVDAEFEEVKDKKG